MFKRRGIRLAGIIVLCGTAWGAPAPDGGDGSVTRGLDGIRGLRPVPAAARDAQEAPLACGVCVIGGGSGGIGAAVAAARAGADVILVEREPALGGTGTRGGVSVWASGPGCALAREIHERLAARADGVDLKDYALTLTRRFGRTLPYNPEAFNRVVTEMLAETGRCRVLLSTCFTEATADPRAGRVASVRTVGEGGAVSRIRAKVFIDCTGDGALCQAAGCETMLGAEPKSRFNEPSAPDEPLNTLNALEMVYRIRKSDNPVPQPLPAGTKPRGRVGKVSCCSDRLPGTEIRVINPCGLMPGWMLIERGYEATLAGAKRQALAHWHVYQHQRPDHTFDSFSPLLAIRESYRVVGEAVLTEQDVKTPFAQSPHADLIAYADHPMDTHGSGGGLRHAAVPYGIPYRCLVPKGGWQNLLIACRGASFSHIAASSCRLQRTMIQLGHAAGLAAAQCVARGCGVSDVDVPALQKALGLPPRLLPWALRLEAVADGFASPEAVCVEPQSGAAYVFNASDGKGFLSRLAPDGKVGPARWAGALPPVKALCIHEGVLHAAAGSRVLRYALATGEALPPVDLPQAGAITGLAAFRRQVYACDPRAGKVYRIAGDRADAVAALRGVSGLTVVEGCLYAVSATERDLYVIDPREGWVPKPFGLAARFRAPNRIEMLADGSFLVSDGEGGGLMCVSPDRRTVRTLAGLPGPADMAVDWKRKRVGVPVAQENRVRFYELRLQETPGTGS